MCLLQVVFHVKSETLSSDALPALPASSEALRSPEYEGAQLDDSRDWKQPVELLLGKKFKMEVWEDCVNTMNTGEIAIFFVDKSVSFKCTCLFMSRVNLVLVLI